MRGFPRAKKPEIVSLRGMLRKNCLWNVIFHPFFSSFFFSLFPFSFLPSSLLPRLWILFPSLRRSSMTFGPIASKCFNISSQSKRAILNIFLTFVTFDQPEYRGMSTARFRVSPLGGWVRCQSNCRTAPKVYERVTLSSGACQRSKKFRTEVHYQRRASLARSSASFYGQRNFIL